MNENKIRIKQYEQAADENVSIGGIKWQRKWDVCIQCDSLEQAREFSAELRRLHEELISANRRAEYWKAEHLEGNRLIDELVGVLKEIQRDVQHMAKGHFVHLPSVDKELTITIAKAEGK